VGEQQHGGVRELEAFAGREPNDTVLWIEGSRAVISGDTLVDFGRGLEINGWLRTGVTREQVLDGLRPLLDPAHHRGRCPRAARP
jgi:glyoxylase-like metal-dependent hydrolase (beta-lactamase superfamily II)